MIGKFLRHRKHKKMIAASSSFILEEFEYIINEAIDHFEKEGRIKNNLYKEVLKFESIAFVIWLFQKTDIFPDLLHKLILDEIHDQYYSELKTNGYSSSLRQAVCDDLNIRYKTYNDSFRGSKDLSIVGTNFIRFLAEKSKVDLDIQDIFMPLYLAEKVTPKFEEFRAITAESSLA
ncbi:MAG: hypothetical protein U5J62_09185 [Desulfurivibrio sp.]|nr:hypothetical protein [Desulfurivibrio sp.]